MYVMYADYAIILKIFVSTRKNSSNNGDVARLHRGVGKIIRHGLVCILYLLHNYFFLLLFYLSV